MDDLVVGRVLRELRLRLGWRQADVAGRAGVSAATYSRLERGDIARTTLRTLRRVGDVLEVRLTLDASWRGAALDRMLSGRHAAMTEIVGRLLIGAGWEIRPEVSFNVWGERGVVDLVAWHAGERALLLVELKTELVDLNNLLATTDRRRRLAAEIVKPFGWQPRIVGQWVVLAASRSNERRVAEHRSVLRAAFPADGRAIGGWLAHPRGPLAALGFLPNSPDTRLRRGLAPTQRVRPRRPRTTPEGGPACRSYCDAAAGLPGGRGA